MGSVIRMVKLFGWEERIGARIDKKRQDELSILRKFRFLSLVNNIFKCVRRAHCLSDTHVFIAISSHLCLWWLRFPPTWVLLKRLFRISTQANVLQTLLAKGELTGNMFHFLKSSLVIDVAAASKVFSSMAGMLFVSSPVEFWITLRTVFQNLIQFFRGVTWSIPVCIQGTTVATFNDTQ